MHTLRCKASKIYTNMYPCHYFFLYLCVFLQSMSASLWKQCFQRLWYRYYQAYQTLFEIPIYLSNDLLNMSSNPLQLTFFTQFLHRYPLLYYTLNPTPSSTYKYPSQGHAQREKVTGYGGGRKGFGPHPDNVWGGGRGLMLTDMWFSAFNKL